MSGRFVRASSYRHVHGVAAKTTGSYTDIRPQSSGDGDFVKANSKFLAYAATGGGGPMVVLPLASVGRVSAPKKIMVHKGKVLDFEFNPFNDNLIATGSEDCYLKVTAFPADGLTADVKESVATMQGHQKKVHLTKWHPTSNNILATGSFDRLIKVWDVEAQAEVLEFKDHGEVPQHLTWNSNGSLLGTCCKDKKLRIFDPRSSGAAQETDGFAGSKKSSFIFMDNHELICTIGFSKSSTRQFNIFDPKKFDKPVHTGDIDQSAGVFMTHYDPDTSMLYLAGKGDSSIRYFEIDSKNAPHMFFLASYSGSNSQKGCGWVPKVALDTTKCEVARCLRLMRDQIVPVSFQVPRKSEMFQADIYCDTYAGVSGQDGAAYLAGTDVEATKTSMKPGEGSSREAVAFVAKKSPAELQAELDTANARIAELEAQLAKLQ